MPLLLYSPKRKSSAIVLGYLSMSAFDSGQTVMADGNSSTVYNAKADTSVYGRLNVTTYTSKIKITKVRYSFLGANNLGKRVLYIDLYLWNGVSYVLFKTLYVNTAGAPAGQIAADFVNLTTCMAEWTIPTATPAILNGSNPKVGYVCRGFQGDPFGYRWITDIWSQVTYDPSLP